MALGRLLIATTLLAGTFGAGFYAGSPDQVHVKNINNRWFSPNDVIIEPKIKKFIKFPKVFNPNSIFMGQGNGITTNLEATNMPYEQKKDIRDRVTAGLPARDDAEDRTKESSKYLFPNL